MEKTRNLKLPLDGKPKLPHRPHPNLLLVGAGFFIRTWTNLFGFDLIGQTTESAQPPSGLRDKQNMLPWHH